MGHLDEEAAFGGALGIHGDGRADVAPRLDVLARFRRDGHVDGRMGRRARLGTGEEVLDEGTEAVELRRCRVPSEEGLARGGLECEGQHVLLVLNVHLDLVFFFRVRDGEACPHLSLAAIFRSGADEGSYDASGLSIFAGVSPDGVVENGKDGLSIPSKISFHISFSFFLSSSFFPFPCGPLQVFPADTTTINCFKHYPRKDPLPQPPVCFLREGAILYLRLDVDGKRGNARLKPGIRMCQRTREVYEALCSNSGHAGQLFDGTNGYGGRRWLRAGCEGEKGVEGGGPPFDMDRFPRCCQISPILTVCLGSSRGCALR